MGVDPQPDAFFRLDDLRDVRDRQPNYVRWDEFVREIHRLKTSLQDELDNIIKQYTAQAQRSSKLERAVEQRSSKLERAVEQRLSKLERAVEQRSSKLERAVEQRLSKLDNKMTQQFAQSLSLMGNATTHQERRAKALGGFLVLVIIFLQFSSIFLAHTAGGVYHGV